MATEIIDGVGTQNHVLSDQVGLAQSGTIGTGALILKIGEQLNYSIVSNNQVNILDGVYVIQGKRGWITPGTVEQCMIDTGNNGQYRNDLICVKYEKDAQSNVETFSFAVVKGTPGASGTDPTYTTGDIDDGALESYAPIYRVRLNGINIDGIDLLATKISSLEEIGNNIGDLSSLPTEAKNSLVDAIGELAQDINELNGKLQWKNLTGVEGVLANQMIYYDDIYDQISEIHVVVQWTINEAISRQSKTFLKSDLTSQGAYFILGGYHSNSFYQFCEIMANKNGIRMNSIMQNGINFTTSAKMWVRYR